MSEPTQEDGDITTRSHCDGCGKSSIWAGPMVGKRHVWCGRCQRSTDHTFDEPRQFKLVKSNVPLGVERTPSVEMAMGLHPMMSHVNAPILAEEVKRLEVELARCQVARRDEESWWREMHDYKARAEAAERDAERFRKLAAKHAEDSDSGAWCEVDLGDFDPVGLPLAEIADALPDAPTVAESTTDQAEAINAVANALALTDSNR